MSEPLITPYGRRDRAAIVARARELHARMEWSAAMAHAHREASEELRARFNRVTSVPPVNVRKGNPILGAG